MADYNLQDEFGTYNEGTDSSNENLDIISDSDYISSESSDYLLEDSEDKKKKNKNKSNRNQPLKTVSKKPAASIKQKTIEDVNKPIQTDFSDFGAPSVNKSDFKSLGQSEQYKKSQADLLAKQKKQTELEQASMERRYAKAAVTKKNKEYLAQTKPSEDYILGVDEEIKNKVQQDGKDETYMDYGRNEFSMPVERTKKINSFHEEKKEVIVELQKSGSLSKYNKKDILDMAAQKYKKKKIAEYVNDKTVSFYTNTSDETKELLEDYRKKDRDFKKLALEKKATVNGTIYDHLNDTAGELESLETKLKEYGDKPVFKTQQELDDYKSLYDEYLSTRKSANQLLNTFSYNNNAIAQSKDELQSAEKEYDMAKRNYGFWTGAGLRTFGAFADMGGSILQLGNFLNPLNPYQDEIAEYIALSTRKGQEMREAYLGEQEKITDLKTFGKASFNVVASQLPNWLLMYATGGGAGAAEKLAVTGAKEIGEAALVEGVELTAKQIAEKTAADIGLGAFKTVAENNQYAKLMDLAVNKLSLSPELASIAAVSGGQKYSEMKASNALGETKYTPLQMLSSSILYGYTEGLSEKVTLDILKGGGRTLEALVKQDNKFVDMLKDQTMSQWFGSTAKLAGKKVTDFANENVSEQFANVAQNSVDKFILGKNVNLLDNTGTVFKDTSLLSAWMISAPHIAGFAIKPFLGKDQTKEIKQNSAEIAKIVDLLKNPALSAEERTIFKGKIKELSDKSETVFKNTIKDIDGMPDNTFKSILSKSNELGSILQKAKNIYNSDSADKMDAIKILEGQYKQKETELNSLVGRTKMISQLKGEFSNEDKAKLFNLTNKAEDLKNEIKSLKDEPASEAVLTEKNEQLKQVNEKITNIVAAERVAALSKKTLQAAKGAGLAANILEFENSDEAEAAANEIGQSLIDEDGTRAEGLEYNGTIIIDREQAAKMFAFNVTGHEFLHRVLKKTLYNIEEIKDEDGNIKGYKTVGSEAARGLASAMKTYLNGLNPELLNDKDFKERLALYNTEGKTVKAEETLTLFADALRLGQLKLEETALTKIGDYIRRMLQDWGFVNIKFKDGKDVVNFLKDYNRAIEKGKLGKAITKVAKEGAEITRGKDGIKKYKDDYIDTVKFSKSKTEEVQKKIDKLESQFENDEIDYDDYTSRLENLELEMEKAKAAPEEAPKKEIKKEISDEDEVKEIVKSEKGSVASEKVQKLYDEKGVDAAQDIINLFKPITKKIVDKRRDAPGFDRELLTDEIETGDGGILYLIKSYKPEKGIPLAAYINRQLPLRAIAASRRVLEGDFKKDVTEEKGLMAEETASEAAEKPKYKNVLESNVFEPEVLKTMSDKIITQLRTLKSRIDEPISLNRTVTPLIAEIRDAIGKQLDIDVKKAMGGKKDNELVNWLLKNKRYMLENMTTTWLMGANGQGGIPQAIQKRIDGKWVSYPEWVDQKIDREAVSTDNAGRTSGAELVRRLPNVFNNVSDTDYLGQFVGLDGNPIRGRKESGAKAVAEESAFDIINKDLAEEGPIYEALAANQQRQGYEVLNNFAVEFSRQSERGSAKRSVSKALDPITKLPSSTKLILIGKDGNKFMDYVATVIDESDAETKFYNTYSTDDFPVKDANIVINAVKKLLSYYNKAYVKKGYREITSGPKENEKFEQYANRRIFNALSKDQSIAAVQGINVEDLQWNTTAQRKSAQENMKAFYKNFSDYQSDKMTKAESNKLFTRLFSRAFAYGKNQSLFEYQESFFNNFLKGKKGFDLSVVAGGKTITYNGEKVNLEISGLEQKTSAPDILKYITTGNIDNINYSSRKELSDASKKDLKIMMETLYNMNKEGLITPIQLGLIFKSLGGSMVSPLKMASELKYASELGGYSRDTQDWVYEHVPPTAWLTRMALGAIKGEKGMTVESFMDSVMANAYVTILPRTVDNVVNSIYKSTMPFYYKAGSNPLVRYFDVGFNGYSIPSLYDLSSKEKINEPIKKGEFYSNEANEEQTAVLNSLSKKSKTPKGISVFDFDDTVGLTNSNVLYTMPDGKTGKLNGAEFAKNGSRLLDEGAVFDFSEFSKVVGGRPGPMVEKMKKMIGKFGPENFFILTARPADSALPIKEFLDSIGIEIPLENITGLGSSSPQAKADWIVQKASDGYNDFYFADDAPQNVEAVKKALNIPGVDSKVQRAIAKFSLTSRQDLKWRQGDEDLSTNFKVGNNSYRIALREIGMMEYDDDISTALLNIVENNNLDYDKTIGDIDGNAYDVEFSDKKMGTGITGTGNAAEVFGTVLNGVIELANKKNIKAFTFNAKEPSRIKLYNSMVNIIADRLGWDSKAENGTYLLYNKSLVQSAKEKTKTATTEIQNNSSWEDLNKGRIYQKNIKAGDSELKLQITNADVKVNFDWDAELSDENFVQLIKENNLDPENFKYVFEPQNTKEFVFINSNKQLENIPAKNISSISNAISEFVSGNNIKTIILSSDNISNGNKNIDNLFKTIATNVSKDLNFNLYSKEGSFILTEKKAAIGSEKGIGSLKPVKDALNVVDIKSPINQSRAKFSKSMNYDFNKILEENTGTERFKVFSDIVARRRGVDKGKFDFYVPASAADFELLLYNFMGKGAKGEEHKKFFADALLKPYSNGNDLMDAARQSIKKNYKALLNLFPDISKKLESLTPDGDFTYDQAIRVAIWNESDVEIPGISKRDIAKLTKLVNDDAQLSAFKDGLIVTGRQGKGWVTPEEYWDSNTIISDLHNLTEGAGRKKFLGEFIDNVEEIFGTWDNGRLTGPNMNKVEALYGTRIREALEDVLYRMTAGKNKSFTKDRETTMWSNWVNGSTGAIMFLNTRSAALQLLGAVNFLNFRDNNPVAAAMAFANQKQYWEDFARIWNSNKMKERRGGLKEDVAAAEIANAAAGSKNKANAVISYLLKVGYTPTQLADSFAIASGGAPFYRNRIKSYLKDGLSQEEAENKAWEDFTKVSDETQQSGDPRDISKQQASGAGRLLLTFQNFSMQQSRIVKKAILDLKNRRGDDKTNISKIIYYLSIQNILFSTLQQGLFAVFFDDDDEDKKKKTNQEKAIGIADDVLDTILRGTGFVGGITVTLKNMIAKYVEESGKKQADYAEVVLEGASISPPIGSKLKKLYKGFEQTKYDKELIKERGWGVMQDGRVHLGPMYSVTGKIVEATTNIPMDRIVNKIENVSQAMNSQNKAWQRVMVGMGWTPYSVGIKGTPGDTRIEAEAKIRNKEESKLKAKIKRENVRDSIANLSDDEYKKYVLKKKAEREAKKDSIKNLPPEERKEYLEAKEKTKALKAREKEILKEAKADSVANLSPAEKAKYDKKVAEEKAAKKEERHQKYLEKKKALQDSLASLSPRERERYKAKKKAERHQYYLEHKDEYAKKRKSKKRSEPEYF